MLCEMEINMNIPDGFLEGEIRNSFYVETMMKKTWAAQLKVLSVVDEICKKKQYTIFCRLGNTSWSCKT